MWECLYCSFTCTRKWNMQVHEKRKHLKQEVDPPVSGTPLCLSFRHLNQQHFDKMYHCNHFYYSSPYLHNVQRHENYPKNIQSAEKNIQRAEKEGKIIIWYPCTFCNYKSDRIYNLKVHMQNCHTFFNNQCTQEAETRTVSSNEKEEHTFIKEEALNHDLHSPLQTMQDVEEAE